MKKILFLLVISLSFSTYAALPKKYVKLGESENFIYYGNTEDGYGNGEAWIAFNNKSGRSSKIERWSASCGRNTISSNNYILYEKKDLTGKVLESSSYKRSGLSMGKTVFPDTVGEDVYNFICYGIY
ncbi:surface-adhesin E family protein [Rodentibacter caecimuris]|uniref:surface-adhesin E family protein n=1 Tax=Rodentibacter caecimuris TaxID=1796644 RepID=UPI00211A946E|nr:surface-adhesin E family protein [Rodentibacter heylii]MCQ9124446.1 hypothetical protein [Rodentibacter heylii]